MSQKTAAHKRWGVAPNGIKRKRIKKNAAPRNGMKNVRFFCRCELHEFVWSSLVGVCLLQLNALDYRWRCGGGGATVALVPKRNKRWLRVTQIPFQKSFGKVMQKNSIILCVDAMLFICSRDIFRVHHFSWMRGARVHILHTLRWEEFYYYSCDGAGCHRWNGWVHTIPNAKEFTHKSTKCTRERDIICGEMHTSPGNNRHTTIQWKTEQKTYFNWMTNLIK